MTNIARPAQQAADAFHDVKDQAEQQARNAVRKAGPWLERLARLGLVAKGVVYLTIGLLSLQAAFGARGDTADREGALRTVGRQPFGKVMLAVIAAGLIGYALWRFIQAFLNPELEDDDAKGWSRRAVRLISGLIYGALALAALQLLTGVGRFRSGGDSTADWTRSLMSWPLGRWLVILAGLAVAGVGVWQFYKAFKADLAKKLELGKMGQAGRDWVVRFGRVGIAARGFVFLVMAGFLVVAGARANPREAKGVGGALEALERAPYGPWLLAAVAAGLIAYGLYQFGEARYRRMPQA